VYNVFEEVCMLSGQSKLVEFLSFPSTIVPHADPALLGNTNSSSAVNYHDNLTSPAFMDELTSTYESGSFSGVAKLAQRNNSQFTPYNFENDRPIKYGPTNSYTLDKHPNNNSNTNYHNSMTSMGPVPTPSYLKYKSSNPSTATAQMFNMFAVCNVTKPSTPIESNNHSNNNFNIANNNTISINTTNINNNNTTNINTNINNPTNISGYNTLPTSNITPAMASNNISTANCIINNITAYNSYNSGNNVNNTLNNANNTIVVDNIYNNDSIMGMMNNVNNINSLNNMNSSMTSLPSNVNNINNITTLTHNVNSINHNINYINNINHNNNNSNNSSLNINNSNNILARYATSKIRNYSDQMRDAEQIREISILEDFLSLDNPPTTNAPHTFV